MNELCAMFNLPIKRFDSVIVLIAPALGVIRQPITRHVLGPKRLVRGLLAGSLAVAVTTLGSPTLARIIKFDPAKSIDTQPLSVNTNGSVVGWYTITENGDPRGFLRSASGTMTLFDVPKAKCGTVPRSINRMGVIAGGFNDNNCNEHGFIRAVDGTFTTFDVSGATETAPLSINDSGEIAGFYNSGSEQHGFLRTADGKIEPFDPKGSTETIPQSINKSGVIAGTYNASSGFVRATDGTITSFNVNDEATYANCINDAGYVVGEYFTNDTFDGFLRTPGGGITTIIPNGTIETVATAINDKQVITGAYSTADGMQHGFTRSAKGGYTTFDPAGSADTYPESINKAGAITGWWADSNSQIHGFLRTP